MVKEKNRAELRQDAIKRLRYLLAADIDYQEAIDQIFNQAGGGKFAPLFEGMSDDERFTEAYHILTDSH